ncbi:MAG: hypothetical protein J6I45_06790 [Clostridia bacterium]|nr:hypothetical protein [Clostridia bacterium]
MKRMMGALLLAAVLLVGCADAVDIPATDVLDAVLAEVEIGDNEVFSLGALDEGSRLRDEMIELLYDTAPEGASDGAVALSKSALGGEVHILRAGNLSQRGRLERILEERAALIGRRQNLLFLSEPDAGLSASVEVKGLYVMLFVTSDNPTAYQAALEVLE